MTQKTQALALALWQRATERQLDEDLDEAIRLYRKSIATFPTAEAHTFLGWAKSWQGDIDGAIEECKQAIQVDPDFGNPYNDIGAYLVEKGQLEEAIGWFEAAKRAKRYDPKHFPCLNLGRVYAALGQSVRAIREFEQAERFNPGDHTARLHIARLRRLN